LLPISHQGGKGIVFSLLAADNRPFIDAIPFELAHIVLLGYSSLWRLFSSNPGASLYNVLKLLQFLAAHPKKAL
jgi:hypothetical protein